MGSSIAAQGRRPRPGSRQRAALQQPQQAVLSDTGAWQAPGSGGQPQQGGQSPKVQSHLRRNDLQTQKYKDSLSPEMLKWQESRPQGHIGRGGGNTYVGHNDAPLENQEELRAQHEAWNASRPGGQPQQGGGKPPKGQGGQKMPTYDPSLPPGTPGGPIRGLEAPGPQNNWNGQGPPQGGGQPQQGGGRPPKGQGGPPPIVHGGPGTGVAGPQVRPRPQGITTREQYEADPTEGGTYGVGQRPSGRPAKGQGGGGRPPKGQQQPQQASARPPKGQGQGRPPKGQ
jgi:hypothetical protein